MSDSGGLQAVPAARAVGWFTTSAALCAAEQHDLGPGWFAVLDPDLPGSYEHNRLVVAAAVPAATLLVAADRVLGEAGLRHRQIDVLGAVTPADAAELVAAGYAHARNVIMARPLAPADAAVAPDPRVEEVPEEEVAPFVGRMWRQQRPPGGTDAVIEDLVRRRRRLDRAGVVQRLVVRGQGAGADATGIDSTGIHSTGIVAHADLVIREGTAELAGIWADPRARGRGSGDALLAECARRSAQAGADLLLLVAGADDWPRRWYARHCFVEVAPMHGFTRWPA